MRFCRVRVAKATSCQKSRRKTALCPGVSRPAIERALQLLGRGGLNLLKCGKRADSGAWTNGQPIRAGEIGWMRKPTKRNPHAFSGAFLLPHDPRRIPSYHRSIGNVFGHNTSRAHSGVFTDGNAAKNGRT